MKRVINYIIKVPNIPFLVMVMIFMMRSLIKAIGMKEWRKSFANHPEGRAKFNKKVLKAYPTWLQVVVAVIVYSWVYILI